MNETLSEGDALNALGVASFEEFFRLREEKRRIDRAEKALACQLFVAYATRIEAPLSAETCAMLAKRNAEVAREQGLL